MSESQWEPDEEANAATAKTMENLEELRRELQATFDNPHGEKTLIWLYDFCRQIRPTYIRGASKDDMLYLEGRRSVILKILEHLKMDDNEIIDRARRLALAQERT